MSGTYVEISINALSQRISKMRSMYIEISIDFFQEKKYLKILLKQTQISFGREYRNLSPETLQEKYLKRFGAQQTISLLEVEYFCHNTELFTMNDWKHARCRAFIVAIKVGRKLEWNFKEFKEGTWPEIWKPDAQ